MLCIQCQLPQLGISTGFVYPIRIFTTVQKPLLSCCPLLPGNNVRFPCAHRDASKSLWKCLWLHRPKAAERVVAAKTEDGDSTPLRPDRSGLASRDPRSTAHGAPPAGSGLVWLHTSRTRADRAFPAVHCSCGDSATAPCSRFCLFSASHGERRAPEHHHRDTAPTNSLVDH